MSLPEVCVVYLVRPRRGMAEVLVGKKRVGVGEGKVVAPGGKLEPGESPPEAAVREVAEEMRAP
jgi:8-oxo-dGTP diphosphatase